MLAVMVQAFARGVGARLGVMAVVGLVALVGSRCAHAYVDTTGLAIQSAMGNGYKIAFSPNGAPVVGSARTYLVGSGAGDVLVRDTATLSGARGSPISVAASRALPVAATAGWLLLAGSSGWAVGTAINNTWLRAGVRNTGTNAAPVWMAVTGGETQVTNNGVPSAASWFRGVNPSCTGSASGPIFNGVAAAQAQIIAVCTTAAGGGPRSFTSCDPYPSTTCRFDAGAFVMSPTLVPADPEAWCVNAAGGVTVRPTGGLCPPETLTPTTQAEAQAKLIAALKGTTNPAIGVVEQAVATPGAAPITGEGATTLTGPATSSGGTTTTTVGGVTTTTTVTNNYTYAGDTVTWNEVSSTTGGSTSTTTTTQPQAEQRTDCDKYPGSVGCTQLGTVTPEQVAKSTRDLTASTEVVGLASGCPAPVSVYQGHAVSFQTACDVAGWVRPLLLASAALGAALMFLAALRGTA